MVKTNNTNSEFFNIVNMMYKLLLFLVRRLSRMINIIIGTLVC